MTLDRETLSTVEAVVSVELTCLLMLVAALVQKHLAREEASAHAGAISPRALRCWVLGTGLVTVGRLAFGLEHPVAAVAASGVLFLGFALVWVGARAYCGVPHSWAPPLAGVAAVLAASSVGPRPGILALSAAGVVASLAIAQTFLAHGPIRQRAVVRFIAHLYVAHAALLFVSGFFPDRLASAAHLEPRAIAALSAVIFHTAWVFAAVGLMCQGLVLRLRDAAHTDGLTGLVNRRALREEAARILELCRRKGRACAVLLADLDHFKQLNDIHGHAAGDAALRHFAKVATACVSGGASIGRWGGEEFCVVLPGASRARARKLALKLKEAMAANPANVGDVSMAVTVSVGVAWGRDAALDFARLIARADEALYRAKEDGRDRVREAA